ncbi:MAG: sulfite exporter TauE/SafE family protein [Rhodospirillales bacterium]|nr:sulfite exporter TauE/SafE family protein [Rhodospirillales bacterium]MBO6788217.1 sulfite exporter TauE/SafE family protein [Rhodospirillales bacterium]
MFGLPADIVILLAFAIFMGGIAKGISGVALPIVTLSIALNFVEPRTGLAAIILSIVVTNVWQAFGARNILIPVRRFWFMAIVFLIFLYTGSLLATRVESWVLFLVIGGAAIVFTATQFYKPDAPPLTPRTEKIVGPIVGVIAGLMGGMTVVWGPPIMMFLFLLRADKEMWVASISFLYLLGSVPLALFYYDNGILADDMLWLSAAACIPAMAGIMIGERIRRYINEALFRKVLLIIIFVGGLNMIRRAFMSI